MPSRIYKQKMYQAETVQISFKISQSAVTSAKCCASLSTTRQISFKSETLWTAVRCMYTIQGGPIKTAHF